MEQSSSRDFTIALALAALLHVGFAAAVLSGAGGDSGAVRGAGVGAGGAGDAGLRFSLGRAAAAPDERGGKARSSQSPTAKEAHELAERKTKPARPAFPAAARPAATSPLVRPLSAKLRQPATPAVAPLARPVANRSSTARPVDAGPPRDLAEAMTRPVGAPPPVNENVNEDDLVELARARTSAASEANASALPAGATASGRAGASGAQGGASPGSSVAAGGGAGPAGDLLSSAAGRSYYLEVSEKIRGSLRYPSRAQREGLEGRVLVSVRIDRDGRLLEGELGESSGAKRLDRDALRTVKRAAPFGAVPDSIAGGGLEFDVPVVYGLH